MCIGVYDVNVAAEVRHFGKSIWHLTLRMFSTPSSKDSGSFSDHTSKSETKATYDPSLSHVLNFRSSTLTEPTKSPGTDMHCDHHSLSHYGRTQHHHRHNLVTNAIGAPDTAANTTRTTTLHIYGSSKQIVQPTIIVSSTCNTEIFLCAARG